MYEPYVQGGPRALGLERALARALRSPFMARKLGQAGIGLDDLVGWEGWLAIPPTTKDELRALRSFEEMFCISPRSDVVEFWRSGGVSGRPLFYPRTKLDVEESLVAFSRGLQLAGVTRGDTLMCSLPLGIHPAGQQMVRAAERLGAATLWAGAGNQTPSLTQIELIHELGVTVWCGMASFGLHLAHLADAAGRTLLQSKVRTVITTAEPLSESKRALLGALWSARVVDTFGMSELTLFGAECGRRAGCHIWSDHVFCEVLDPRSSQPVPPGEVGVLCVTGLRGTEATPFVRWLSGDMVRLEYGCACDEARHPRLVHSGRTTDFFKVKGVNLNHGELEDALYQVPDLRDYRVTVTRQDDLRIELECADGMVARVRQAVEDLFVHRFGVRAEIVPVARGTIVKSTEVEVKARRFIDQRGEA